MKRIADTNAQKNARPNVQQGQEAGGEPYDNPVARLVDTDGADSTCGVVMCASVRLKPIRCLARQEWNKTVKMTILSECLSDDACTPSTMSGDNESNKRN